MSTDGVTDSGRSAARPFKQRLSELQPLLPRHAEFVYATMTNLDTAWRWRFRGDTPSWDTLAAHLWDGVAVQQLVVAKQTQEMAGIVSLYGANYRSGFAYLSAVAHPHYEGTGVVTEGAAGLIDYAFRTLSLRKVYIEALEFNTSQFGALASLAREEGRLAEHELHDGAYWDFVTYAVRSRDWFDFIDNPRGFVHIRRNPDGSSQTNVTLPDV